MPQQAGEAPQPVAATPPNPRDDPTFGLRSASMATEAGPCAPHPNLAIPPGCWPDPCRGSTCDSCDDPLESWCPDQDQFFIYPPRPRWYFRGDGGALRRQPQTNVNFASQNGNIVLSTGSFNFDFAASGHFLVGHTLNECFQIEGVYQGIAKSENDATVRDTTFGLLGGTGNLFSPFGSFGARPVAGLDFNNFAQITYSSSFQSAELNIRRKVPMPPQRLAASILFGVRYIGLPEDFDYFTQATSSVPGIASTNAIHIATDNTMVGPQIGGMFDFYVDNRWWLTLEGKAAVLNNRSGQSTTYRNVDSTGATSVFAFSTHEDHTAFAGDVDINFVYRWTPHFTTRLGYQALFLTGQALAANNFNNNINVLRLGPAQLEHDQQMVYHGPHAGIEVAW